MDWEGILQEFVLFHNITLTKISPEDVLMLTGGFPGPKNVTELQKSKEREIIVRYVAPIILLFGLLGNLTSSVVLLQKQMRKLSANIYLAVLSITDITVLLTGLFLVWLSVVFKINIKTTSDFCCKFFNFLSVSSSQFSSWLLVCVSFERLMAIRYPMKTRAFSRTFKTWKCILIILTVITVGNAHLFWTVQLSSADGIIKLKTCGIGDSRKSFQQAWPWIDSFVYSFIPCFLLIILNSTSILALFKQPNTTSLRRHVHNKNTIRNYNRNTTMTLCVLSFMFIITTAPMCFLLITRSVLENHFTFVNYWILRTVSDILMYCDHSFNFVLYCLSGSNFRNKLVQFFFVTNKRKGIRKEVPRNMFSMKNI